MKLLCWSLLAASVMAMKPAQPPNILFILQDDTGNYDLGFTEGDPEAMLVSSNITKLAKEGIILTNHYVHWHCSPSRRSFITGRLPVHHSELLSSVKTDDIDLRWTWISTKLKKAGYMNYWIGKGHTGYKSMNHLPVNQDFDQHLGFLGGAGDYYTMPRWEDEGPAPKSMDSEYSTHLFGDHLLDMLDNHNASKPFFAYLPWQAVHEPYELPPNPLLGVSKIHAMLYDSDLVVGRAVQALKDKNMYDNTLIIYSPDNGGVTDGNNYPLRGEKHTNWQGAMKVAAFVSGGFVPKALRGTSSNLTSHIVDWYPTLCNLAGVDPTDDPPVAPLPVDPNNPKKDIYGEHSFPSIDGVDIWSMLTNPTANASAAHPEIVLSREVILIGNWKLVVAQPDPSTMAAKKLNNGWKTQNGIWVDADDDEFPCNQYEDRTDFKPCLFDLESDPRERHNLAGQYKEKVAEMWTKLNTTWLTFYGKDHSPAGLLGKCDEACADAKWPSDNEGPYCGLTGCK